MEVRHRQRLGAERTTFAGLLDNGQRYAIEVPEAWNGILLLYSKPVPVRLGQPPWSPDEPLIRHLVDHGYVVAGCANSIFWPLEDAFADQPGVLEIADQLVGQPRQTIGFGLSIGGIVSAATVQRYPGRLSGALPMCGNLAGAVATYNRELDIAFVVKTLLAPETSLQLVHITNPRANLQLAREVLYESQGTAAGRARLALAAAMGNIPGWFDPALDEPSPDDIHGRQRNQFAWLHDPGFLVYFFCRAQMELQAGGNPSWNTGVDYGALLSDSVNGEQVAALYWDAGLDLEEDLERLGDEPRLAAEPAALDYLERHVVFNGELGGTPVLTMHTDGDGLVTSGNARAYAEVVHSAGSHELLRQLFVHRAGHCTFTLAEITAALDALVVRIDTGAWPDLDPDNLNEVIDQCGPETRRLAMGEGWANAGFCRLDPPRFARRFDVRDVGPVAGPQAEQNARRICRTDSSTVCRCAGTTTSGSGGGS